MARKKLEYAKPWRRPKDKLACCSVGFDLTHRRKIVHSWTKSRIFMVFLLIFVAILCKVDCSRMDDSEIDATVVKNWALKFGKSIAEGSAEATCQRKITQNYKDLGAEVEFVPATQMLEEMRNDVQNMLSWKREAIERIAQMAEKAATEHVFSKSLQITYLNAKRLYNAIDEGNPDIKIPADWKPIELKPHKNFDIPISMHKSVIRVATNIYEDEPKVLNDVKWSDILDTTFQNNMATDPNIMYQFFGTTSGMFRMFPGFVWRTADDPDLYDNRLRNWYIKAAASAKDVVILLDGSGSMTGLRKEIAKNVVLNILDTLTENDYFTILRFTGHIQQVVPCFEDSLVLANEENIREFKVNLKGLETKDIANFSLALRSAFELLNKYNRTKQGSQCNQAIMLITDGSPYNYEEIFKEFNWPNIPVRVFTYLIGREVTEMREVYWMACANRGYYTHVSTLSEVREQVQKYIPVMSRPLVLSGQRPVTWTPVYADITERKLTDWLWEERERAKIRKAYMKSRERHQRALDIFDISATTPASAAHALPEDVNETASTTAPPEQEQNDKMPGLADEPPVPKKPRRKKIVNLITTVSVPVFDRRNYSMRVANLLGVAGTDVPLKEITKLTPAYKLGVNGYSFAVNNNGYILYHPDLRPLFQDLIKPGYSSVDVTEVELVDNVTSNSWEIDDGLMAMRKNMINRKIGWSVLPIKIHLDGMKRVITRNNSYYYGPIEGTPFSLAIVLPKPYGQYRVNGQIEVKRREEDLMQYFHGSNWRVHPNWIYCDSPPNEQSEVLSPEDKIRKFLKESLPTQQFRWRTSSTRPVIYDIPNCEKDLVQSLVFDAKATDIDVKKCAPLKIPSKYEERMMKMYGIVTTFVATRSGLLRYEDHLTEEQRQNITDKLIYQLNTKATEELFYRRAVDYYRINSSAFVFSVPFDAGSRNGSLVTGSHAIFLGSGEKKAPASVVGLQFKHSAFAERFFNTTSRCMQSCKYTCSDEQLDCYLLDNNGFVVVSEIHEQTGKFFGEIDNTLFDSMLNLGFYRKVRMYDYQAICLDIISHSGPASSLLTPFKQLATLLLWFWGKITMYLVEYQMHSWWSETWAFGSEIVHDDEAEPEPDSYFSQINKTRPRPCTKEFDVYEMQPQDKEETMKVRLSRCHTSGCDMQFIVQQVPYTNLVMLVVYNVCPCEKTFATMDQQEGVFNESERCEYMMKGRYRQRPNFCVNYHAEELDIKHQCGRGHSLSASISTVFGIGALYWQFVKFFV